jgi:3-methyladenine DNA glycosylase AlkD
MCDNATMKASDVIQALQKHASPEDAVFLQRFFKTGEGQYGAGDVFIGVRMPQVREVCKQFKDLPLAEVQTLFDSDIHEYRMAAGIILDYQYKKSSEREAIYNLYLHNVLAGRVNNWDLVDVTCRDVVGRYLWETETPRDVLFKLAKSDNLWQKRVAIISTFYFLGKGDPSTSLELAELLVNEKQDLLQKAVGWTLREVGKQVDTKLLTAFLDKHAATMPRTALRYAVEHFSHELKTHYMRLAG